MARADTIRIATYHTELSRQGPGLLLRDLAAPDDPQITATVAVIAALDADVLILQGMDHDAGHAALGALSRRIAALGVEYPYQLALRPNTGLPTGHDLDGDGRAYRPRDAHGYGYFNGQGGMALLSRLPIAETRDFSEFLWRDLPDSSAPSVVPGAALPVLRLASVGAWDVALDRPDGPLHILMSHATPPVFDGPEDRNGLRNADELRFWQLYLDGWSPDGTAFDAPAFVVAGTFNVDPLRGEGRAEGVAALLRHPALQDPEPTGADGTSTADWAEPRPGNLRVDYILPAAGATILGHGVWWSDTIHGVPLSEASDHRPVWIDLQF